MSFTLNLVNTGKVLSQLQPVEQACCTQLHCTLLFFSPSKCFVVVWWGTYAWKSGLEAEAWTSTLSWREFLQKCPVEAISPLGRWCFLGHQQWGQKKPWTLKFLGVRKVRIQHKACGMTGDIFSGRARHRSFLNKLWLKVFWSLLRDQLPSQQEKGGLVCVGRQVHYACADRFAWHQLRCSLHLALVLSSSAPLSLLQALTIF